MKKSKILCTLFAGVCLSIFVPAAFSSAKTYRPGFQSQKIPRSIKKQITGVSYPKKNSLISYNDLRYLKMRYIDFQGETRSGEMIVNKKIAKKTLKIFYKLYQIKYPIQRMELVDYYDGDDEASMAANNTSAFNYRKIAGTNRLSKHGYGLAIDINPRINPCVTTTGISPANGKPYSIRKTSLCNGMYASYMIHQKDKIYRLFRKYGFQWGGDWKTKKDYQHFEYSN